MSIICDQLEIIPKDIVIHQLLVMRREYVDWSYVGINKSDMAIDKEMERRDSWQGAK